MAYYDPGSKSARDGSRRLADLRPTVRLALMLLVGAAGGIVTAVLGHTSYAPLVSWDLAALVFSGSVWPVIASSDAAKTAALAVREDVGRTQTDAIVLGASVASLVAVGYVLIQASTAKGHAQDWLAGLGVLSVALSWFAVHTLFAVRYARLYYEGGSGGIDFNQRTVAPRYLDFAYVAFTIGMTFQVSDTALQDPAIRATALRHALLSYLFGAVVLGASINLIAGLASKSGG